MNESDDVKMVWRIECKTPLGGWELLDVSPGRKETEDEGEASTAFKQYAHETDRRRLSNLRLVKVTREVVECR